MAGQYLVKPELRKSAGQKLIHHYSSFNRGSGLFPTRKSGMKVVGAFRRDRGDLQISSPPLGMGRFSRSGRPRSVDSSPVSHLKGALYIVYIRRRASGAAPSDLTQRV